MPEPPIWSLEQLASESLGRVVLWASPSVRDRVERQFPWLVVHHPAQISTEIDTIVAVGGGTLLDLAKVYRHDEAPHARLVAIPSIWGSGAEASPIVVINHQDRKEIRQGDAFLPDVRVIWPDLAETLPDIRVADACGDTWAHALEGFGSPLADRSLRLELAEIIAELIRLPLSVDPTWFYVSARSCAAQARAGVGLVHGISHVLEPLLKIEQPERDWGHARLCSLFLWPVLRLSLVVSSRLTELANEYGVDIASVESIARRLFDEDAFTAALPSLAANWRHVLRYPCSRTNGVLVKKEHLSFFTERAFL
jgi:alcohol dehydrogenase class IV